MKVLEALLATIGGLIAGDATLLALAANMPKVKLITNANPEGDDNTPPPLVGELTFPTTAGLTAAIDLTGDTQLESREPGSGDILVELDYPAGGFRWESSAVPATAETVTGVALVSHDGATLYGIQALPNGPVTIDNTNQAVDAGPIGFRIPVAGIGNI